MISIKYFDIARSFRCDIMSAGAHRASRLAAFLSSLLTRGPGEDLRNTKFNCAAQNDQEKLQPFRDGYMDNIIKKSFRVRAGHWSLVPTPKTW